MLSLRIDGKLYEVEVLYDPERETWAAAVDYAGQMIHYYPATTLEVAVEGLGGRVRYVTSGK